MGLRSAKTTLFASVVATIALLISLLVAELTLRIAVPGWAFLDPRTDAYWNTRLQGSSSPDPMAVQHDLEVDPGLGWRMKRNYSSAGAHHDSDGFRIHRVRTPNRAGKKIFMIGDSFTYGLGVQDDETMAAQLERITGAQTVNAGVNGFGVDQAFLIWELEGQATPQDVIVLSYYVDDFYRNLLSVRDGPKPHLVRDGRSYRFSGVDSQAASTARSERRSSLRLLDVPAYLARRLRRRLGWRDAIYAEAAERSQFLLLALRESVAASGAKLVVIVIPPCRKIADSDTDNAAASILATVSSLQIDALDLTEMNRDETFYGEHCHWTVRGHRFAAERLVAMLGL